MADPAAAHAPGNLDSGHLADIMKALSNPVRIDLLKTLRSARTLGEIRLQPRRRDATARPGRPISRAATREHLDRLLELGMVRCIRRVRDGRALDHYVINPGQVFALLEELRPLVHLRPEEAALDGTVPAPAVAPLSQPGAKLALVSGAGEGRVFPLVGADAWLVGRRGGSAIRLDYDPYLSTEHAQVARRGRGFAVRDLGSRNGTAVNWEPLAPDEWRALVPGDILGVGRSVLVFRD